MFDGQEFPFSDLRIRDVIKHLRKKKKEGRKAEKQMVDTFFLKGNRKIFLLSVSLKSLNALVLLLRR